MSSRNVCDVTSSFVFATDVKSFNSESPEFLGLGRKITKGIFENILSGRQKFIPFDLENVFIQIMTEAINFRVNSGPHRNDFLVHIIAVKLRKTRLIEAAVAGPFSSTRSKLLQLSLCNAFTKLPKAREFKRSSEPTSLKTLTMPEIWVSRRCPIFSISTKFFMKLRDFIRRSCSQRKFSSKTNWIT